MDEFFERKYPKHIRKLKELLQCYQLPIIIGWSFMLFLPTDLICYVCGSLRINFTKFIVRRDRRRRHASTRSTSSSETGCCAASAACRQGFATAGCSRSHMFAGEKSRAIGGIVDPHLAIQIETRRPVEAADVRLRRGSGREIPVLRAVRTGSTAAALRRAQPGDRAIEPRRIERVPHHRFATGMKAHAAALPDGNQHGIRRQPIAHELRACRDNVLPAAAIRTPAGRRPRACRECRAARRRSESRRPCGRATAARTPTALARISSSNERGNQEAQVPPLGIRLIQQVDRDHDGGKASSSTGRLALDPAKTIGASTPMSGTTYCVWKIARPEIRQVRR